MFVTVLKKFKTKATYRCKIYYYTEWMNKSLDDFQGREKENVKTVDSAKEI